MVSALDVIPALRTASAVQHRIDHFLDRKRSKPTLPITLRLVQCDCCLRFERVVLLSRRGWCRVCEREFRRVVVKLGGVA